LATGTSATPRGGRFLSWRVFWAQRGPGRGRGSRACACCAALPGAARPAAEAREGAGLLLLLLLLLHGGELLSVYQGIHRAILPLACRQVLLRLRGRTLPDGRSAARYQEQMMRRLQNRDRSLRQLQPVAHRCRDFVVLSQFFCPFVMLPKCSLTWLLRHEPALSGPNAWQRQRAQTLQARAVAVEPRSAPRWVAGWNFGRVTLEE
jgi:hypothetical protein